MFRKFVFPIVIILSMILAACGGTKTTEAPAATEPPAAQATEPPAAEATEPPAAEATEPPASQYTEAPMLADMVKAGTIPALDDRLPEDVFVVGPGIYMTNENLPDWTPGKYGGTVRMAHASANWNPDAFVMLNEPFLMAPKIGDQNIICNVCKEFAVSNDNKVFTFTLRKGLKWSDGEPVTTEDVRFAYEDIRQNTELAPTGVPNQWRAGFTSSGSPGVLEIMDDYTFKVTFDAPYGAFLRALTIEGWVGYTQVLEPAHYLKQFHNKYTSMDVLQPLMDAANQPDWPQYFATIRCQNWDMSNPRCAGYPAMNPWLPTDSGNPSLLTWERNPYYFKVDTLGQQLPYVDKLASTQVNDMEAITLKIVTGEVDFQRESTALVKMPLYKESEATAGFRVQLLDMHVDSSSLRLNQTFDDANWQSISRDIRFRQAVSLAINRQELIDTIYYGYASLPLDTVGEEFSKYDVAKANQLLDDMGLTEKDGDGYRKYPDGSTITMLLEHSAPAPDITYVADLIPTYLKAIGLKTDVKLLENALYGTKWPANEIMFTSHWSHDVGWGNDIGSGNIDRAGPLWWDWIESHGSTGVEPPQWIKDVVEIDATKWASVAGSAEYNAQVQAAYKWCRDNLPYINLVEHVKYPLIVNKDLRNVATGGYAIATNFSAVQMWFDR